MKINKNRNQKKKIAIILALLVVIILGVFGAYFYSRNNSTLPTDNTPEAASSSPEDTPNKGSISSGKEEINTEQPQPATPTGIKPAQPSGVFVSNHEPNLSGSPTPNTMSSTCTTTPGSECRIEFRNGSTIKSLQSKKVDSNGNTSWDWSLQEVGLSEGTWKITAVATNGDQSTTSNDQIDLVVRK